MSQSAPDRSGSAALIAAASLRSFEMAGDDIAVIADMGRDVGASRRCRAEMDEGDQYGDHQHGTAGRQPGDGARLPVGMLERLPRVIISHSA